MYTVFLLLHVLIALSLIVLVLIQQGKGAEAGAAFGSGASSTVFGSRGSASFLTRLTAGLATGFFLTSLILAYFLTQAAAPDSITDSLGDAGSVISEPLTPSAPDTAPAAASDLPSLPEESAAENAGTGNIGAGTDDGDGGDGDGAPADDVPAPAN